jgi:hypothetical protein
MSGRARQVICFFEHNTYRHSIVFLILTLSEIVGLTSTLECNMIFPKWKRARRKNPFKVSSYERTTNNHSIFNFSI